MELRSAFFFIPMVCMWTTALADTTFPTTTPPGCVYNGKHYPPGSTIEEGYDQSSNWCYGTMCDMNGQIQHWDDFHCVKTTTPPTTIPPTTTPPTTIPPGCLHNGKHYPPGSAVERGYDPGSNWCYGTVCDMNGQIQHWDDFNCVKTTTPPTTIPPTTTPPTTIPPGCVYNGKHYPPGTTIEKGYNPGSNWCYGTICDMNGQIQYWDDFHCVKTTTPPTTIPPTATPPTIVPPTTTPTTTIPPTTTPTTMPGCVYNGKHYPPGTTIEKGYDPGSNWCYITICDMNGQILNGDDFNCVKTSTPPTTIPPSTPKPQQVVG